MHKVMKDPNSDVSLLLHPKECKRRQIYGMVDIVVFYSALMRLMGALRGCFPSGSQFDL